MTNTTNEARDLQALATIVAQKLNEAPISESAAGEGRAWARDESYADHVARAVIRLGEHTAQVGSRDAMTISFHQATHKKDKRIEIQACWPTHDDGRNLHYPTPRKWIDGKESGLPEGPIKITVAADASPERVAKDIVRRIMPNYVSGWADCQAQIQEMIAAQDETEAVAKRLGVKGGHDGRFHDYINCGEGATYATVEVAQGKVSIECRSLDEATAAKILKILRGE